MKRIFGSSVVACLLAMLVGCGGGGGGGGSSSAAVYHSQEITAYTSANQMLALRDLIVGDVVQLNITALDKNNNLVILPPASGWRTNAPSTVATLTSSGVLTAVAPSSTTYTIGVTLGGVTFSGSLVVSSTGDLVTGLVRNTTYPIENAIVDIYDGTGKLVGISYTARDGTFRASVPSTAAKFMIDMTLADPNNYYYIDQFGYGDYQYLEVTSCLAPLPSPLSATSVTPLPNPIVPYQRSNPGPPPPPTGCVG